MEFHRSRPLRRPPKYPSENLEQRADSLKNVAESRFLASAFLFRKSLRLKSGGNIVLAIIFALAALMTVSGLVLRSRGSYLGSFFSSESLESREAAEHGLRTIVSELARTPNRKLLVGNKNASNAWIKPDSWVTSSSATQNPCAVSSDGVYTPPSPIPGATDTSKVSLPGQGDKKYWLRSVTYKNESPSGVRNSVTFSRSSPVSGWSASPSSAYSGTAINLAGVTRGYIELQVQGESEQSGKTSTAIVTKEFELVPKCCGRSFGYTYGTITSPQQTFGQDLRACGAIGQGVLNLVTGANGDGIFSTNGKAFDLWENQVGTNQDQAITLNPSDAKPIDPNTNLVPTTQELPPQISEPPGIPNSGCISGNSSLTLPSGGDGTNETLACRDGTVEVRENVYQENVRADSSGGKTKTLSCPSGQFSVAPNTAPTIPSSSIVLDKRGVVTSADSTNCYVFTTRITSQVTPFCIEYPMSSKSWYCKIRYVDKLGGELIVDSSGGKTVTLLFTDAKQTGTGASAILGGSSSFAGNGGYRHLIDPINLVDAPLADSFRFRVVNNIVGSVFELKGATGALAGFFDLRYSDVLLYGGGANTNINLSGILWTNNLSLNGNATLVNPPSGNCSLPDPLPGTTCALLKALYPSLFDDDPNNDVTRPAFDFTPRSIFSLRMFGA